MKTWEMMKMLTENPKAKFRCGATNGLMCGCIDGNVTLFNSQFERIYDYPIVTKMLDIDDWELVEELVIFEEVVAEMRNGNSFRCGGYEKGANKYDSEVWCSGGCILPGNNGICTTGILNGKWKIL